MTTPVPAITLESDAGGVPLAVSASRRDTAREQGPAFLADWEKTIFVHLAVEPQHLQPLVPFTLDLHEGLAYVSLVAFTMRHMRPAWCHGPLGELALRPICPCRFLNARTYVRARGGRGIYFLAEWLSAWASIPLGPLIYGLPYRAGRLRFHSDPSIGTWEISIRSVGGGEISARGAFKPNSTYRPAASGSRDEFLLERYTAYTVCRGEARAFQVEHAPWPQVRSEVDLRTATLLGSTGSWANHARVAGAHYSPGVFQVGMGGPRRLGTAVLHGKDGRTAFVPAAFS